MTQKHSQMKLKYKSTILFAAIIFNFIFYACSSGIDLSAIDDSSIKLDESLVMPIGEANLTVKDVINRIGLPSELDTASNEINFLWNYADSVQVDEINVNKFHPFDRKYIIKNYLQPQLLGVNIPINSILPLLIINDTLDLDINTNTAKERVDSIKVVASKIEINFDVSDDLKILKPSDFSIQFGFPETNVKTKTGFPIYHPTTFNQPGNYIIENYTIITHSLRTLPFTIKISLKPSANFNFSDTSFINLNFKLNKIDYSVAYGLFDLNDKDQKTIEIPFKIEDYLPKANIRFANPTIKIKATTNIGSNLDINVDYLAAYSSSNPTNKIYAWFDNHTTMKKTEFCAGPTKYGSETVTEFPQYDSENGELDRLFHNAPYPDYLNYSYSIASNPSRAFNFISQNSQLKFDLKIEIPLKAKGGSNYAITDTLERIDFKQIPDFIDSAILVLKLKNGLPLRAKYRMTFWKSSLPNDTVVATPDLSVGISNDYISHNMTSEFLLKSPQVDQSGLVKEISEQIIKISLSKNEIESLKQTKFIVFKLLLDTDETMKDGTLISNPLHITTKSSFGVKLGVFVNGSYKTTLENIK